MANVLILGARAPVALDHARRFAAQGWRVCIADSNACRLSASSRAVAASVRLAPPRTAPAEFVSDLNQTIASHRIDLVLPTCEEVFYLSRYRGLLPHQVRVLADDFDKLRNLHSKWRFLALAADCGADLPESALVESIEQARAWAAGAAVVLKPEYSRFGTHVRIHPRGIPANAPPLRDGHWVVQRYCEGTEVCSYSVVQDGTVLAQATYRPRYRLRGSSSYYFDPVTAPAIDAFVRRFAARTGFTGQLSFDWILGADGRRHVIECNPRAISGLHLFGRDEPLPAALAGERDQPLPECARAPRMLAQVMLGPGLAAAIGHGQLPQWWNDYRRAHDVLTDGGDIAPLAGAMADLGAYAWRALRQGGTLRQAATHDIEWDGESLPEPEVASDG